MSWPRLSGIALAIVLLAGCADDGGPTVGSVAEPIDLSADGPLSASGRVTIPGFDEVGVEVITGSGDLLEWCLLLAAAAEQIGQGLMNVVDLGAYAGMFFDLPAETTSGFWMRDTPMPLSIAYLDDTGAVVDTADMDPCLDRGDDCPGYPPDGPYVSTVEVPQGGLEDLGLDGPDARLVRTGSCEPA